MSNPTERPMKHPECRITYFATAMALIELVTDEGNLRLLTDPVLDAAGSEFDHGPVHLTKTTGATVRAQDLGRIDAILLSHDQHADNLDNGGRKLLASAGQVLTTPEAASRLGGNALGMIEWETQRLSGPGFDLSITALPAQHGPDGTQAATGPVTGFLLEWPGQQHGALYISGDTVLFNGTDEIARRCRIGTALLHLGRVQLAPMGDLVFSLSASAAARYGQALGLQTLIPLHFDGWAHFTEGRAAADASFEHTPMRAKVRWLETGVATVLLV